MKLQTLLQIILMMSFLTLLVAVMETPSIGFDPLTGPGITVLDLTK